MPYECHNSLADQRQHNEADDEVVDEAHHAVEALRENVKGT